MTFVEPVTQARPRDQRPREAERPTFSIVAPVYNEEVLLPEFYRRVVAAIEPLGEPFEIILVNDGSRDRSLQIMLELHERDPRVKVINFSRNFGHQIAITAGTDYARGKAVVVIDSDLQDPPEVIVDMIARWREGYQLVYGVRSEREGETVFKLATASLFYRLIRKITSVDIPVDTGDFRLMDRKVVDALKSMREHHRFMRGLSVWVGFKQTGITYKRDARKAGVTKYPLRKMLKFAMDGITAFSYLPLQLATYVGFSVAALGLLGIIAVIFLRLLGNELLGQATTLVAVLFMGGVQLVFLGIIGEYLGRIYDEVKQRPLYIVADAIGFDE
ncbi:MAG: glycosyltransferase family 2 protein [Roseiflexus sp.]|nr:glycosyltransferase family 2 protein [Roseiflexus sp.]MCS7288373.1 glycosyltransferase family 2 protein [Roseiflexus sp.]MDW8146523.1 glycosyltransferase family 2 protein [Roseiflexaceae bacterium]MDW8231198.1 glycosyltransferase family 2 protein [Roseiflexaceae bacterium]